MTVTVHVAIVGVLAFVTELLQLLVRGVQCRLHYVWLLLTLQLLGQSCVAGGIIVAGRHWQNLG